MSAASAPRVLCIAGSPRRHGNSETLLEACARGVSAAGGQPETLAVVEFGLHPCLGCNACSRTGECVIEDRMSEVYAPIDSAEAIVVASPVYFASVPAVLKTLYDRLQPYWARKYVLGEPAPPRRPGAFLVVRGGGDPYGVEAAVYPTKSVFAVLGVDYTEELVVEGPDSPSEIECHPVALARAEKVGMAVVAAVNKRRMRR